MKAIRVSVDKNQEMISNGANTTCESWADVCDRFDQDVHRIRDIETLPPFTGLYECIDADNHREYYAVQESESLYRMRRKTFLGNVGQQVEASNHDE